MGSKIIVCRQCGKLFQSLGSGNCPVCVEEMDKAFVLVKEYLYDHQDATVIDVVNDTGVSEKYVLSFLKEGRIDVDSAGEMLSCEDCGRPITSGRFCSKCRDKLANMLSGAVIKEKKGPEISVQAKMHTRYGRN